MNKTILLTLSIIIIIVTLINSARNITSQKLRVIICNVGQGDGIIVITPQNRSILIDGGPDDSIQSCITKRRAFFNRSINGIIVSHFHADHISGFINLFKSYSVQSIISNPIDYPSSEKFEFDRLSKQETLNRFEVWQGDIINIEKDVSIQVLWPAPNAWNRKNGNWEAYLSDFNDSSLVLLLKFKQTAVLFTGDAGSNVLNEVARHESFADLVKSTQFRIYKISHHGSSDAISTQIIDKFRPSVAVISSGKNNSFGHPHIETIKSLKNVPLYSTAKSKDIELTTDGVSLWVEVEDNSSKIPYY